MFVEIEISPRLAARAGRRVAVLIAMALLLLTVGCEDKQAHIATFVGPVFDAALPLIERDTGEVRSGLPRGAAELAKRLDDDPGADLEGLKRAIVRARAGVHELAVAKSTFFVFVDPSGKVLRGEADPDLAAGESLTKAIPEAKKLFAADGVLELWGYLHGFRGVEKGGDLQWIVGAPVKRPDGKVLGAYVTGWSLRKYAEYLETHVRASLTAAQQDKSKPIPLVYALLARGDKAYGGPVTPQSNADQIGKLGLVDKCANGEFRTSLVLSERRFLVVARRVPALAKEVALVFMLSAV